MQNTTAKTNTTAVFKIHTDSTMFQGVLYVGNILKI